MKMPDIIKSNPGKFVLAAAIIIFVSSQVYLFYKQRNASNKSVVKTNLESIQPANRHHHTHTTNPLEAIALPDFTLPSTEGAVFARRDMAKNRFSLFLLFNNLSCSDCIWTALNNLGKYHDEIQNLNGDIVAITDSATWVTGKIHGLSNALHLKFPILLSVDVNTFFPDTVSWKPPAMLLFDGNLNRVIYARYEDGIDRECEKFIKKALRLYSSHSFE